MKLYNTLTRKKEEFKPISDKKVTMYVCGPTVYNFIHVGNARPLVVFDALRRYLTYKGYEVDYLVNFTDIDDKMINKAIEEDKTVKEIAEKFIKEYYVDTENLNINEKDTKHPKATEHISDIIKFIKELENKEYAYNVDGNVYFNINKLSDYGKLSNKNVDDLVSGARIEVNNEKRDPFDFALWKKEKPGEPSWNSPWGSGRPGWHIECSVMARKYLGDTIDIHAGGHDLEFPHHENEIAQSESLTGKPFTNYWLHNAMINVDDKKMSKSEMNFFTVREVSKEFDLEALRYFILSSHYRSPINFSREILQQSKNGLDRLYNGKKNLEYLLEQSKNENFTEEDKKTYKIIDEYKEKFLNSLEDDLNTADAIASLFELIKYTNSNFNENTSLKLIKHASEILMNLSDILGLLQRKEVELDEEVINLIKERTEARKNKDYKRSDEIRDLLKEKGIIIEDTSDGVKWKRI